MIFVKSQRSDEDSAVILSQHKPTPSGLKSAFKSYSLWLERWSKVYPTQTCQMRLWMEFKGQNLDPDIACAAIEGEFGEWFHIKRIMDVFTSIDELNIPGEELRE